MPSAGLEYTPPRVAREQLVDVELAALRGAIDGERRAFDGLAARVSTLDEHVGARLDAIETTLARLREQSDELAKLMRGEGARVATTAAAGGVGGSVVAGAVVALVRFLLGG